jgi:Concanavalin A-like lectin/glucanases superfamily/Glycosyltransferase WbsX
MPGQTVLREHRLPRIRGIFCAIVLLLVCQSSPRGAEAPTSTASESPKIDIRRFLPDKPINRSTRPATVSADVINLGETDADLTVTLRLPTGVRVLRTNAERSIHLTSSDGETHLTWELEASAATSGELQLELTENARSVAHQSLSVQFLPAVVARKLPYIPEPKPAATDMLIGAHHCPLWESDKPNMWLNVLKHPERTPALGYYSQDNPEVADWETKWAVEHGISFFIYCWYRTSQGGAVRTQFGSAIHDGLFKSRFASRMKFTIMWENQSRGNAGVADERDLFGNLLPYWITNYFQHPSYLKIDNKPVLFIYRPEFLVQDLGSQEKVAKAFEKMRQVCREAGFDGLYLLGEYRGTDPQHLTIMKGLGLDYTFAYCWYVPDNPTPDRAIRTQMEYIRKTQELNILPQVVTVSQAWSGWADEGTIWKIPPTDFEHLLHQAKDFAAALPPQQLGSRMLLLDNWNEWGEGHYIAPYREYGFGYLDAVRNVFSTSSRGHQDLIPEDIGMGPYDTVVRGYFERERQHRCLMTRKVLKPGAPEGLAAWWTFDEEPDTPVVFDVSGHRLGAGMRQAKRAAGFSGSALVCDGGTVVVPNDPQLSALKLLTIECRVKTELPGQDNKWMLNRVFGNDPSSGFRLGVLGGKPCFEVPLTNWSHHLTGPEPLPTGRWVHLAATFDGKTMRLFMDGAQCATMERAGEIHPNLSPLVLGNYDVGHPAHFVGLLDDVRLYHRVLPPAEIRVHAAAHAE